MMSNCLALCLLFTLSSVVFCSLIPLTDAWKIESGEIPVESMMSSEEMNMELGNIPQWVDESSFTSRNQQKSSPLVQLVF
ncbi:unnamed protein product [Heterobilharzia americana]|nr:unnamed protein product [Heterobilharzia americana]